MPWACGVHGAWLCEPFSKWLLSFCNYAVDMRAGMIIYWGILWNIIHTDWLLGQCSRCCYGNQNVLGDLWVAAAF